MNFFAKFVLVLLVSVCTAPSLHSLENADQTSIYSVLSNWENAWNINGGKGLAECYSADADFVNPFGTLFSGNEEIENRHILILSSFLKQAQFTVQDVKLREVSSGLVVAHVFWELKNGHVLPPESRPSENLKGIFTHVFILKNGLWKITSSQNTFTSNPRG
jgi:uncharacterized protein (TIGR02246 family)